MMVTGRLLQERKVAGAALREAARMCQAVQRGLGYGVLEKGDRSPVTVADFGSQALICRALKESFPNDRIVAEEDAAALRHASQERVAAEVVQRVQAIRGDCGRSEVFRWIDYGNDVPGSGRFWTLDPIDGTKGFLRGAQYAIALALIEDGVVRVAALACPNLDGGLFLSAVRGAGASCEPLDAGSAPQLISVSTTDTMARARFCESVESGHSAHEDARRLALHLGIAAGSVRLDSQAKYAVVARGSAEIYLRLPTRRDYQEKIWDHAAGALILQEAGGTVTDASGRTLDFSQGRTLARNKGIVATNGRLHAAVMHAMDVLGIGRGGT